MDGTWKDPFEPGVQLWYWKEDPTEAALRRIDAAAREHSNRLDLSGLRLSVLPDALGQLTTLTELDLRENQLATLPDWIGQLTTLTWLNLSGNQVTVLPDSIGQLTALTELHLGRNWLTTLPDSLAQLTALSGLSLGNNLTVLPDWIGQLTALTELHLGRNQLTTLPESIGNLTALTKLDLRENQLTTLPDSIGHLTALTDLIVAGNRLSTLPESIGNLTALTSLELYDNLLTVLPDSIGHLTALTYFEVGFNKRLSTPPREVLAQGTRAVLEFLQALSESAVQRWRSKVLVVGEGTVGKTSLTKQLFGEAFDPHERQTHGLRVRALPLPHPERADIMMYLDVWDFGGQLEYRATQRFYLTDRSLFLLVWNARQHANDGKVIAWLDAINARAPDAPILIVATHGDNDFPATLPRDLSSRYPSIVGAHTVDSRTRLGIDELRTAIAGHAGDLPLMGARWPAAWETAANALESLPGLTCTTRRAGAAMANLGVTDPAAQRAITRILHELGSIASFPDFADLATRIILNPQWLDERITQVIDSEEVTAADGLLSRDERHRLWGRLAEQEDDDQLPDRLIRMMEAFDLAYRVGDPDESRDVALIVDRLPDDPPSEVDVVWYEQRTAPGRREIAIIYKLASRQAGIPGYFIAREHRYTTGLHWRFGALLHDRAPDTPAWALITDDGREQPTLTLRVTGAYPVRFQSVLIEAFDRIITARYPGLVEARLIPCACRSAENSTCPHAFTLEELLVEATAEDGDRKVRCPKSRRRIEAALMLDGLRGTGLIEQLDAHHRELTAALRHQADTLTALEAHQQAQLNGIRMLLEHRANTDTHGPALYSIIATDRSLLHPKRITLTLWCEWPSGPHLLTGENGSYTLAAAPPALIRYLPYLKALITALGLAVPLLGAAGQALSDQAKSQIEAASRTLEYIAQHTETTAYLPSDEALDQQRGTILASSSADIRALSALLATIDPKNEKNWGDLSPVSRPEDRRTLYLCPHHAREYDYPYNSPGATP